MLNAQVSSKKPFSIHVATFLLNMSKKAMVFHTTNWKTLFAQLMCLKCKKAHLIRFKKHGLTSKCSLPCKQEVVFILLSHCFPLRCVTACPATTEAKYAHFPWPKWIVHVWRLLGNITYSWSQCTLQSHPTKAMLFSIGLNVFTYNVYLPGMPFPLLQEQGELSLCCPTAVQGPFISYGTLLIAPSVDWFKTVPADIVDTTP